MSPYAILPHVEPNAYVILSTMMMRVAVLNCWKQFCEVRLHCHEHSIQTRMTTWESSVLATRAHVICVQPFDLVLTRRLQPAYFGSKLCHDAQLGLSLESSCGNLNNVRYNHPTFTVTLTTITFKTESKKICSTNRRFTTVLGKQCDFGGFANP
jgi:hypothetical protein